MKEIDVLHQELMENPEYQKEYENSRVDFELQKALIRMRHDCNLTQNQLAARSGVRQSNISRMENGGYNPNLSTLKALANGCGKRLKIEFE